MMWMSVQLHHYLEAGNVPEDLSTSDMNDLTYVVDEKMKEINMKMVQLEKDERS